MERTADGLMEGWRKMEGDRQIEGERERDEGRWVVTLKSTQVYFPSMLLDSLL